MNDRIALLEMVHVLHKPPNRILRVIGLFHIPKKGKGMDTSIDRRDLSALDEFFYGHIPGHKLMKE